MVWLKIEGAAMPLKIIEAPSSLKKKIDGPEPIPKTAFMPLDDTIRYPKGVIIKKLLHEVVLPHKNGIGL